MIDRKELARAIEAWNILPRYANNDMALIVEAARAHLATLPRTKMVKVWAVDYAYQLVVASLNGDKIKWSPQRYLCDTKDQAERWIASSYHCDRMRCVCCSEVEHEVPDDD